MNGILLIDKPDGITSAEVVRRVKRRAGGKVGHLGTLDPFATGLLPLCLGEATKIAQFLNTADKGYEGTIRLGQATGPAHVLGPETRRGAPLPLGAARG
jgi:tRNA pseudouridine55 synthase